MKNYIEIGSRGSPLLLTMRNAEDAKWVLIENASGAQFMELAIHSFDQNKVKLIRGGFVNGLAVLPQNSFDEVFMANILGGEGDYLSDYPYEIDYDKLPELCRRVLKKDGLVTVIEDYTPDRVIIPFVRDVFEREGFAFQSLSQNIFSYTQRRGRGDQFILKLRKK